MADKKRISLVKSYNAARAAGKNEELVKMVTEDIIVIDRKDVEYKGHAGFQKYLKDNPSPLIPPFVGEPILQSDGSYTVTLYIPAFLNAEGRFYFAKDSDLICKIVTRDL